MRGIVIEFDGLTVKTDCGYSVTAEHQYEALEMICEIIKLNAKWLTSIDRVMLEDKEQDNQ